MPNFLFPLHTSEPKYRQIIQTIKSYIENQQLQVNESLPSIRQLAENLQVSRNTVATAYEQLVAEGFIRNESRKGYFVNPLPSFKTIPATHMQLLTRQHTLPINFRAGAIDSTHFPIDKWRACGNEILREDLLYTYGNPLGDELLRNELAQYVLQARGISVQPHEILIGSSTQQLLLTLTLLLKQHHTTILCENPGYNGARTVFELQGFHCEPWSVSPTEGHVFSELELTQASLAYVTPAHQFPFGYTMSIQERSKLLEWAKVRGALLIEDDYDGEFRYEQHPVPALASLDRHSVIYVGTFSKSFLPALRLSYAILPPKFIAHYQQTLQQIEQNASFLHQRTMALFMKKGYWRAHIRKMRAVYRRKMLILTKAIHCYFPSSVHVIGTRSGLAVILLIPQANTQQFIQKAVQVGVQVYDATPFFFAPPHYAAIQIGFSNCSIEEIEEGIQRLASAWFSE